MIKATEAFPEELAELNLRFNSIEDAYLRVALAKALGAVLDAAMGLPLMSLTFEQQAVIDVLRSCSHPLSAKQLADNFEGCSAAAIKRWCGPDGVLQRFGVICANQGYTIA